ncbi:MAG: NAD(P)-dependent oxidoreductase [Candidatus Limnocylindria bacterium]
MRSRRSRPPAPTTFVLDLGDALARGAVAGNADVEAVLTLPSTPATDRIVDRAALAALPARAVLINVARGRVLDEDALIDALRRGVIRGAVLDVASSEPIPPTAHGGTCRVSC